MYLKRLRFSPDPSEGGDGGQAQAIDFAANEQAAIDYFKGKGIVIGTKEEIQTTFVNPAVQKTHEDWEKGMGEHLGEKPAGEKGLNWAKSKVASLKNPAPADPPKDETPKPGSVSDEVTKAQLKATQDKLDALMNSVTEKEAASALKAVNGSFKGTLKAIKFSPDEAEDSIRRASAEQLVRANYTIKLNDDDEPVLYKGDAPEIDPETSKPITLDKVIKRDYSFLLTPERKEVVGGTGTVKTTIINPANIMDAYIGKSMQDIREESHRRAMAVGDPKRTEWIKASAKASGLDPDSL